MLNKLLLKAQESCTGMRAYYEKPDGLPGYVLVNDRADRDRWDIVAPDDTVVQSFQYSIYAGTSAVRQGLRARR